MKKKRLLVLLILIFLCACTFINQKQTEPLAVDDVTLMEKFDEVVEKAGNYMKVNGSTEVQSVFQHQSAHIWKIEFTDGSIVLYDEHTGEMTQAE